jgi:hypothetical protein
MLGFGEKDVPPLSFFSSPHFSSSGTDLDEQPAKELSGNPETP